MHFRTSMKLFYESPFLFHLSLSFLFIIEIIGLLIIFTSIKPLYIFSNTCGISVLHWCRSPNSEHHLGKQGNIHLSWPLKKRDKLACELRILKFLMKNNFNSVSLCGTISTFSMSVRAVASNKNCLVLDINSTKKLAVF